MPDRKEHYDNLYMFFKMLKLAFVERAKRIILPLLSIRTK